LALHFTSQIFFIKTGIAFSIFVYRDWFSLWAKLIVVLILPSASCSLVRGGKLDWLHSLVIISMNSTTFASKCLDLFNSSTWVSIDKLKITDESLAGNSLFSKPDYSTKLLNSSNIIKGLPPGLTCFPENFL
jgi:hypothetical protein